MTVNLVTLVLFFVLSYWVYRAWTLGRYRYCLYGSLLLSLVIHANGIFYFYLNTWDEAFHAVVAKNLLNHPLEPILYEDAALPAPPEDWRKIHVWLHKPPLTLWCIALSLKVFGVNEVAVRIPSVIFSLLSVWLTFLMGCRLFSGAAAGAACYLYAINGMLFDLSTGRQFSDHVDTLFILLIQLAVWFALRLLPSRDGSGNERPRAPILSSALLVGGAVGLAFLTKLFAAFLPLVLLAYILSGLRTPPGDIVKYLSAALSVSALFIVPWSLYAYLQWPSSFVAGIFGKLGYITHPAEDWSGGVFYHWIRIPRFYGELSVLSLPFVFYHAWRSHDLPLRILSIWALVPYLVFSLTVTKAPAYPFIAAPAVCLINGYFIRYVYEIKQKSSSGLKRKLLAGLLIVFIVLNVRVSLERQKLHKTPARHIEYFDTLKEFCRTINRNNEKVAIFRVPSPTAMFYCNAPVYFDLPDRKTTESLESREYKVLIYADERYAE
ncbi:MAG: ArnT family glycosyltransferase [Nitrospinales bacterium]